MAEQLEINPGTRLDRVGRTGIYPMSGPRPDTDAPIRGQGELGHPEMRSRSKYPLRWPGNSTLLAIGRALFGGFFVYNGINHLRNRRMMAEYARLKQVPMPEAAVVGSGVMILLGGLSVLAGAQPKIGASLIATFLLGVTPKMHAFWDLEDPQQRSQELVNFAKNVALAGGASLVAAVPEPWPFSLRPGTVPA